jgi:phage tail-like protein
MPIPRGKANFTVRFGDDHAVGFQEVTGLEPTKHSVKIPSVHKAGGVTLKRGVIASNANFWNCYKHSGKPRTGVIKLQGERGKASATWPLTNARPIKVTAPDLNAKETM